MADDLNTPRALAELHGLARALNTAVAGGHGVTPSAVAAAADLLVRALDVLGLASLDRGRRDVRRGARARRRSAQLRGRQATTRAPTSCATASRRSGSQFATPRRGPQVVPLDG